MNIETLQSLLGWSAVVNMGLLLYWWAMFVWAHEWIYRLHSRWFLISRQQFDAIHYGGMGLYKLFILFFNVIPWLLI